jgi:hypothetical protein
VFQRRVKSAPLAVTKNINPKKENEYENKTIINSGPDRHVRGMHFIAGRGLDFDDFDSKQ